MKKKNFCRNIEQLLNSDTKTAPQEVLEDIRNLFARIQVPGILSWNGRYLLIIPIQKS